MRLDRANRSFAALVLGGLLLGMYLICGAVECVLLPLIVARVSHRGVGGLVNGSHNLLSAMVFVLLVCGGCATRGQVSVAADHSLARTGHMGSLTRARADR